MLLYKSVAFSALFALCISPLHAESYKIDPDHSFIVFKVSHLGISTIVGEFPGMQGTFVYDKENPGKSSVKAEVKTANVDTAHAERDKHLRKSDFLDVGKFPKATFTSTGFEGNGDKGVLKGELELMGIKKPIEIQVVKIGEGKDPWGGYRAGFEGSTTLSREDFNLGKKAGFADQVKMEFFIEGIKE